MAAWALEGGRAPWAGPARRDEGEAHGCSARARALPVAGLQEEGRQDQGLTSSWADPWARSGGGLTAVPSVTRVAGRQRPGDRGLPDHPEDLRDPAHRDRHNPGVDPGADPGRGLEVLADLGVDRREVLEVGLRGVPGWDWCQTPSCAAGAALDSEGRVVLRAVGHE